MLDADAKIGGFSEGKAASNHVRNLAEILAKEHSETGGIPELHGGGLAVRLAKNEAEIEAAQATRYKVFVEELGVSCTEEERRLKRDMDKFDARADHLLAIDTSIENGPKGIVGTYRLLRSDMIKPGENFYSAGEFDISQLLKFEGVLLEVGRSCVLKDYRRQVAMQLMWRGLTNYLFLHKIDVIFGCASLAGANPEKHAKVLSYLYHNHLAPPALRVKALPERYVDMQKIPLDSLNRRECLSELPALLKGYLRLGGFVGDGAVVDEDFKCTDVAVLVKTELMTDKYYRHYERQLRNALGDIS
ncbi:GNAT family N-acetyltransferase [Acetobacteraceae bacterium]|nr:GNAT family N-acetyltransferase [Acetobacteraceae bacterium]